MQPTKTMAEPQAKSVPAPTKQPTALDTRVAMRSPGTLQRAAGGALPPSDGAPTAVRAADVLGASGSDLDAVGRARMAHGLQRMVGNARLSRMLDPQPESSSAHGMAAHVPTSSRAMPLQRKLTVNQPGDIYEQEADRVADQVMRMPEPQQESRCTCGGIVEAGGECAQCRMRRMEVQRQPTTSSAPAVDASQAAPPIVEEVLRLPGQPLDPATRAFMEPRFGHDFSQVRVHADAQAVESARAVGARAYMAGSHVAFGAGQYQPYSDSGRQLLAHELAHVVQQSGGTSAGRLEIGNPHSNAGNAVSSIANQQMHMTPAAEVEQASPVLLRAPTPTVMCAPIFTSTLEICRRLLKSRVFHVSQGGAVVTANAGWEASSEWQGAEPPSCGREIYGISLSRVGWIFDSEVGTRGFEQGKPVSRRWTNLPEGDYYLTISTSNTNPNCCLRGDIEVSQESGLVDATSASDRDVAAMSAGEKIAEALKRAGTKLGPELGARINELLTPESIAMMVTFTSLYIVSQLTPVGWVADIIAGGLLLATVLMVGREAVEVVEHLIAFLRIASTATTESDFDEAAEHVAVAVTTPDFTPIEQAFSKIKAILRGLGARTKEALQEAVRLAIEAITRHDAAAWFAHAGYALPAQAT